MSWDISERFPSWGETGEFPADGFFYENGDQVNEKHLDALWNGINGFEEEVQTALNEIDSDGDGKVDIAENADDAANVTSTYKGNDIDSDGDGKVDIAENADQLDGKDASAFASSSHPSNTNNPHNVTDNQTGAATALSNHESDNDAHHVRPTSTANTNVEHWQNLTKQQGSVGLGLDNDNGPTSETLLVSNIHHNSHDFLISGKVYVDAEINMDEFNGADYELYDFEIQKWDDTWVMIDDSKLIDTRLDGSGGTDTATYTNTYTFNPKRIQAFRITKNQFDVGGGGSTSTYGTMTIRPAQAKTSDHNHNI